MAKFVLVAITPETKKLLDSIAEKTKMKKYEIIQHALRQFSGDACIMVSEEQIQTIKKLKKELNLQSDAEVIDAMLLIVRVLFDERLKFYKALKPINQLLEELNDA